MRELWFVTHTPPSFKESSALSMPWDAAMAAPYARRIAAVAPVETRRWVRLESPRRRGLGASRVRSRARSRERGKDILLPPIGCSARGWRVGGTRARLRRPALFDYSNSAKDPAVQNILPFALASKTPSPAFASAALTSPIEHRITAPPQRRRLPALVTPPFSLPALVTPPFSLPASSPGIGLVARTASPVGRPQRTRVQPT